LAAVTYRTLSTQQLIYIANLLYFCDISRILESFVSKQRFVLKTNLNIGKRAFSSVLCLRNAAGVSTPPDWVSVELQPDACLLRGQKKRLMDGQLESVRERHQTP